MTGAAAGNSAMADRVGALETRVGQIAAGKAPEAAAASFDELAAQYRRPQGPRSMPTRHGSSAVEKSSGASGNADDCRALKAAIDKNSSDIAQLSQQIDKLAQRAGQAPMRPIRRLASEARGG